MMDDFDDDEDHDGEDGYGNDGVEFMMPMVVMMMTASGHNTIDGE